MLGCKKNFNRSWSSGVWHIASQLGHKYLCGFFFFSWKALGGRTTWTETRSSHVSRSGCHQSKLTITFSLERIPNLTHFFNCFTRNTCSRGHCSQYLLIAFCRYNLFCACICNISGVKVRSVNYWMHIKYIRSTEVCASCIYIFLWGNEDILEKLTHWVHSAGDGLCSPSELRELEE